ncbi:PI31 proteasome regulator N-terminal-domain-containing protein [Lophiotrema nucula]|uniref:PI31 proteasome regulator N-terminal-domain-containing protein n=1 Tax=Lophiotrema nucula TaxID=690887 RepID=A0A6A5ZRI8_9PLEO|nr:PI31 proteasome regulator N-terminal-domain-containing protein [Lophiotrema nucula]
MVQPNSAGNPLSAGSLSTFMAVSLPKGELKNGFEAVALAVHAGMIAVGFRLIGLGEEHRIAHSDAQTPESLPAEWNASSSYAFRYRHAQSAMEYLVKVTRLGGKAIVNALADGDDKIASFDVVVKDYVSESSLPLNLPESTPAEELAQKLQDVYISEGRLNDLGALLKISVIQKLAPSLQKEGYEEDRQRHVEAERREGQAERSDPRPADPFRPPRDPDPARPYPYNDPLAMPPRGPNRPLPEPIPGFEDEYEINRPRPGLRDDRFPAGIGHDDLYPPGLGPHDPLRPSFGGGLPRPGGMGGGMHPSFDDPLFRGQGGQGGYDPRAPPGARYDPVGPSDPLRDNSRRGGGPGGFPGGGFGGGAPHNPFGGFGGGDFI